MNWQQQVLASSPCEIRLIVMTREQFGRTEQVLLIQCH